MWSKSSERILFGNHDRIHIYSIQNPNFSAALSNLTSATTKATYVSFGGDHNEVLVFSDFGMKLAIYNLTTSTSIELLCPKFFGPSTAMKGYDYRPTSQHFALLTRTGGKDVISIHSKQTYDVIRSWHVETLDAQALSWSPDGRWLSVIESAAHGHRILIHTADGHLYKLWQGPAATGDKEHDNDLGAGAKMLDWNTCGSYLAVSDHSTCVSILSTPSFIQSLRLDHMMTIKPSRSLQVWHCRMFEVNENANNSSGMARAHTASTNWGLGQIIRSCDPGHLSTNN